MSVSLRDAFLRASRESREPGWPSEVTRALNLLPRDAFAGDDSALIAAIDAIMGDLYEQHRLTCPGHRWSSEEVSSIRGDLLGLYERGWIRRDAFGRWAADGAYYYVVRSTWQAWLGGVL